MLEVQERNIAYKGDTMIKDNVLAAILAVDFLTTPSKDFGLAYAWAERILTTIQVSPEYLTHIYNSLSNQEIEISAIMDYVTAITGDSVDNAIKGIQNCKKPNLTSLQEDSLMKAYDAMQVVYQRNYEQDNPYVYTPEQIRDVLSKINVLADKIELKILFDEEEREKTLKLFKLKEQKGLLAYTSDQSKEIEHMVPKSTIRTSQEDIFGVALILVTENKLRNIITSNPVAVMAYLKTTNQRDFIKTYNDIMGNHRIANEYVSKYMDYLQQYDIKNTNIKNFSAKQAEYNDELHILLLKDYYESIINRPNKA
jgi:hypothetical protein